MESDLRTSDPVTFSDLVRATLAVGTKLSHIYTLSMRSGYKSEKEQFVSFTSGSSVWHVNSISAVALVSTR